MSEDRCPSMDPLGDLQCERKPHWDDACQYEGIGWRKGTPLRLVCACLHGRFMHSDVAGDTRCRKCECGSWRPVDLGAAQTEPPKTVNVMGNWRDLTHEQAAKVPSLRDLPALDDEDRAAISAVVHQNYYMPDVFAAVASIVRKYAKELNDARATIARVRDLAESTESIVGFQFLGEPFPPAVTLADLQAALDGAEDSAGRWKAL